MSLNIEIEYWDDDECGKSDIQKQTVGNCKLVFKNNMLYVYQYGKLIFEIDFENDNIKKPTQNGTEFYKLLSHSIW